MHFKLEIETDNAGMQTVEDLVECVRDVLGRVRDCGTGESGGKIRDVNGNIVGKWSLVLQEAS